MRLLFYLVFQLQYYNESIAPFWREFLIYFIF